MLRVGAILVLLAAAGIWLMWRPGGSAPREPADPASAPTPSRPLIIMEGFKTEVTNRGKLRQQIEAQWGQSDEDEKIVDMRDIVMRFYDQGEFRGEAHCGSGRLWQTERPAEGHGANDMRLSDNVRYHSSDGQVIQTPSMDFLNADQMLRTTAGYVRQFTSGGSLWVDRGQLLKVTLLANKGTFQKIHEQSDTQVTWEKIDKPVIEP
jgi:hypothetical protein